MPNMEESEHENTLQGFFQYTLGYFTYLKSLEGRKIQSS